MNGVLLVLIIVVIAAIGLAVYSSSKASGRRTAASLADAKADARRLIERLGGQVLNITGTDDASKQAMADASERYTAASSQIDQATTPRQAVLAKESAIEGLYYVRAARTAMGMDPGPELGVADRPAVGGHRHRRPSDQLRGPRNRGVADTVAAHPELLPRRPRRRSSRAGRLVFGAVVETGPGGRRVGPWICPAVRRDVLAACTELITAHRVSRAATATATKTASRPDRTAVATAAAGTAAAPTLAVSTGTAVTVAVAGTAAAGIGGGDFGGGDFGGFGDF